MSSQNVSARTVNPVKWIAVQLSSLGEREKDPSTLEYAIHRCLGKDINVFIPSIALKRQEESHTLCYMEGYIFVEFHDGINYLKLLNVPLFKDVLHNIRGGAVTYNLIDDSVLNPVKDGLEAMKHVELDIDTRVKINKGTFKNLTGVVSQLYDETETVQVFVKLKSKEVFIDFPASYLDNLDALEAKKKL